MFISHAQQRQRHANVVVQIAHCRENSGITSYLTQYQRKHLLHRCLSVAARNCDKRQSKTGSPKRCQYPKGQTRILHFDDSCIGSSDVCAMLNHNADSAGCKSVVCKHPTVKVLTTYSDEQVSCAHVTAISSHALKPDIGSLEAGAHGLRCSG